MTRFALTVLTAAAVSAWAGAQTASGPTTADRLKLLAANRVLLGQLIDDGLAVSDAVTPLDRAETCNRAAGTLVKALEAASAGPSANADRVAELSDYLTAVIADGLRPALAEAGREIPPGSQHYPRLEKAEEAAAAAARTAAEARGRAAVKK